MKGKIEALAAAAAAAVAAGAAAVWAKRKRDQAGPQADVAGTGGVRAPAKVSAPTPAPAKVSASAPAKVSASAPAKVSASSAPAAPVPDRVHSGAGAEEAGGSAEGDVAPAADDLTSVKGIGAVNARKLAAIHITTFAQIAAWTDEDINRVGNEIDESPGRIKREDWVGQAQAKLGS